MGSDRQDDTKNQYDRDKLRNAVRALWEKTRSTEQIAAFNDIKGLIEQAETLIVGQIPDDSTRKTALYHLSQTLKATETSMIEQSSGQQEWLDKAEEHYRWSLIRPG